MDLEDKVQSVIGDFCSEDKSFTSLDVSNKVKQEGFASTRHRQIAEIVRRQYDLGAMADYDYERSLVDVELLNGLATKAYLYHHNSVSPDDYIERKQVAIIPTQASDVEEEADEEVDEEEEMREMLRTGKSDGRVEVPAWWVQELGWAPGETVYVVNEGNNLALCLENEVSNNNNVLTTTKITPDRRLRIPKTAFINAKYQCFGEYKLCLCDDCIEVFDITPALPHSTFVF